jgi:hypothetical protein
LFVEDDPMMQLRQSQRVYFAGHSGARLAGIIDMPETEPREYLIFAHCFTCTKDIKAVVRISRLLAQHGFGVLRTAKVISATRIFRPPGMICEQPLAI